MRQYLPVSFTIIIGITIILVLLPAGGAFLKVKTMKGNTTTLLPVLSKTSSLLFRPTIPVAAGRRSRPKILLPNDSSSCCHCRMLHNDQNQFFYYNNKRTLEQRRRRRRFLPMISSFHRASTTANTIIGTSRDKDTSSRCCISMGSRSSSGDNYGQFQKNDSTKKETTPKKSSSSSKIMTRHRQYNNNDETPPFLSYSVSPFFLVPFPSWLTQTLATTVAISTGLVALFATQLYLNQEKMLYIPELEDQIPRRNALNPKGYKSPEEYNIPYEEFQIPTMDEKVQVHALLLLQRQQQQQKKPPTIVFFHGNAGNIGMRLPNAKQMYDVLGANILLVEYRGYGDSNDNGSKPTEQGIKRDAEAVYKFIASQKHSKIDPNQIFLFGRSLGGAVAFYLAEWVQDQQQQQQQQQQLQVPPLAGIIVENTFVSIPRMVDVLFPPFISKFKGLVLRMEYNSGAIASRLKTPILYLAGDKDEIVPHSQMLELFERSQQSSEFPRMHVIKFGTHNEAWIQGGKSYWKSIQSFLSDVIIQKNKKD